MKNIVMKEIMGQSRRDEVEYNLYAGTAARQNHNSLRADAFCLKWEKGVSGALHRRW